MEALKKWLFNEAGSGSGAGYGAGYGDGIKMFDGKLSIK